MKAMDDSHHFDATPSACIPNPLDLTAGEHRIRFVQAKAMARLMVFTASGYKVYESSEFKSVAGLTDMHWRGTDDEGRAVPGGIYVYAVMADGKILRRDKIAVVR
jgi:flagellar hook assembly protein FlgD